MVGGCCFFLVLKLKPIRPVVQDQNFDRATFSKRDAQLCPCLLPAGKYIITGTHGVRLLSTEETDMHVESKKTSSLFAPKTRGECNSPGEDVSPRRWVGGV